MTASSSPITSEMLARLSGLELRARVLVEGYLAGLHRSPHEGFSVEFAEHREYVPGDDLRYLDWKVFGKRDRYYLKQFEAETTFTCHLLVDLSESMAFRSDDAALSKADYAKCLAAAVAAIVLRQQDAVGLTIFDSHIRSELPASGGNRRSAQSCTTWPGDSVVAASSSSSATCSTNRTTLPRDCSTSASSATT